MQSPLPLPGEDLPKAFAATEQLCRKLMRYITDTSNARESTKATSRNATAFIEDARARIVRDEASLELTPATAANASASLTLEASMLRMLNRPPEAAE